MNADGRSPATLRNQGIFNMREQRQQRRDENFTDSSATSASSCFRHLAEWAGAVERRQVVVVLRGVCFGKTRNGANYAPSLVRFDLVFQHRPATGRAKWWSIARSNRVLKTEARGVEFATQVAAMRYGVRHIRGKNTRMQNSVFPENGRYFAPGSAEWRCKTGDAIASHAVVGTCVNQPAA